MVLDYGTNSTGENSDVINVEAANPTDEPEITLQWVKEKAQAGHDLFREFRSKAEELDDFYLNNFDFSVPENGTLIRLGTAQSVINTLVAHVSPQFLDISVPPPGAR